MFIKLQSNAEQPRIEVFIPSLITSLLSKNTGSHFPQCLGGFLRTLFLFPSVLLQIKLYPNIRNQVWDFPIREQLFNIIFIFLNFNLFSVVGSKLADFFTWPSKNNVVLPIALRFLFIPLFYMANYRYVVAKSYSDKMHGLLGQVITVQLTSTSPMNTLSSL